MGSFSFTCLERVKEVLRPRDLLLSAHDSAVRQSTLPSERGHHATSASTYLDFRWHALLSCASLDRDSASPVDGESFAPFVLIQDWSDASAAFHCHEVLSGMQHGNWGVKTMPQLDKIQVLFSWIWIFSVFPTDGSNCDIKLWIQWCKVKVQIIKWINIDQYANQQPNQCLLVKMRLSMRL